MLIRIDLRPQEVLTLAAILNTQAIRSEMNATTVTRKSGVRAAEHHWSKMQLCQMVEKELLRQHLANRE